MNVITQIYIVWLLESVRSGISDINRKNGEINCRIKDLENELYVLNDRIGENQKNKQPNFY